MLIFFAIFNNLSTIYRTIKFVLP